MKEELLKGLTEEQLAKVKTCKSQEEMLSLATAEGVELSEEQLEAINGGGCYDCRASSAPIATKKAASPSVAVAAAPAIIGVPSNAIAAATSSKKASNSASFCLFCHRHGGIRLRMRSIDTPFDSAMADALIAKRGNGQERRTAQRLDPRANRQSQDVQSN